MKIICARLITGEEIIAKVVAGQRMVSGMGTLPTDGDELFEGDVWEVPTGSRAVVTLEDARIVTLQQVPGRGVGISFIPYTMANPEQKVKINLEKHAMSVYPPEQNLERAYIGENSQIQLATEATAAAQGIKLK